MIAIVVVFEASWWREHRFRGSRDFIAQLAPRIEDYLGYAIREPDGFQEYRRRRLAEIAVDAFVRRATPGGTII